MGAILGQDAFFSTDIWTYGDLKLKMDNFTYRFINYDYDAYRLCMNRIGVLRTFFVNKRIK